MNLKRQDLSKRIAMKCCFYYRLKVSIRFAAGKNSAKILSLGKHEKPWIQLFTDISKSNEILLIGRLKPKSSITRSLCT